MRRTAPVAHKKAAACAKGPSSALIAAAFQNQFMSDLRLDLRAKPPIAAAKSESTLAERMGMLDVLVHAKEVLALSGASAVQGHFVVPAATDWATVERTCVERQFAEESCSICRDDFQLQPQVLLSCSHVFHASCISSFERFTGHKTCPLCRHTPYERRPCLLGADIHRRRCAIK
jgi:hypothetical protein